MRKPEYRVHGEDGIQFRDVSRLYVDDACTLAFAGGDGLFDLLRRPQR